MKNKKWLPVLGYKGFYEVSNKGEVRSLTRVVKASLANASKRIVKGRLLKQGSDKNGYRIVSLSKNCKTKTRSVHRLVMEAFTSKEEWGAVINHKDENPSNNSIDNLEWCSYSYNARYSLYRSPSKGNTWKTNAKSKFNEKTLNMVFKMSKNKARKDIAKIFKVSRQTIDSILNAKTYKSVTVELKKQKESRIKTPHKSKGHQQLSH